jgi:serine/threonine-protein kinase RsbW
MADHLAVQRTFPCDATQLATIRNWASEVVSQAALSDSAMADIKLALSEGITNVIVHSAEARRDDWIDLTIEIDDHRVLLVIRDSGECFDLDRYVAPDLDQLAERGYGVFLMRAVMDGVAFGSFGAGSEVRMWKWRGDAPAQ